MNLQVWSMTVFSETVVATQFSSHFKFVFSKIYPNSIFDTIEELTELKSF